MYISLYFRMMNQSWTRLPGILQTVTKTFSTQEERESVVEFQKQLESSDQLGGLESTFTGILGVIDANIKWRTENEGPIIEWINSNHSANGTDSPIDSTGSVNATDVPIDSTGNGTESPIDSTTESGAIFIGISGLYLSLLMI